jgi:hypothetical protein
MKTRKEEEMRNNTKSASGQVDILELRKLLTTGQMRFAPLRQERSIRAQIQGLSQEGLACFVHLKATWETWFPNDPYDDEMYLRFSRCSPGKPFDEISAWKSMKHFDRRYSGLTASALEFQLRTKTLFPLPGLRTTNLHEVFYMRPARFVPTNTQTKTVIDNLVYVMSTMMEREGPCSNGISFIANMDDWTMKCFTTDYCLQFMLTLQGRIPARVTGFFIVNPPSWFGSIWKMMKPMLSPQFRKKVYMIPEAELKHHMAVGYENFLPDELSSGRADTDSIVSDFVDYRMFVEAQPSNGQGDLKETARRLKGGSADVRGGKRRNRLIFGRKQPRNTSTVESEK